MRPRPTLAARLLPLGVLSLAALTTGCAATSLSQPWQLDRVRALGIRAEPAEPQPGETVVFSSLYYFPEGQELDQALWFACLPETADSFGCELSDEDLALFASLADLDFESLTPTELAELFTALQEAGLAGIEPDLPPSWTPAEDSLDDLDAADQLEGKSAVVNITVTPRAVGAAPGSGAQDPDADIEVLYKRVPVSLAATPNHNPDLAGVSVDGVTLQATDEDRTWGPLLATPGETYDFTPLFADDAIEDYQFTLSDGTVEDRTEEPYVTYFAEGGSFDQYFALYDPDLPDAVSVQWTAPTEVPETGRVDVILVLRDRRGGMDWATVQVTLD